MKKCETQIRVTDVSFTCFDTPILYLRLQLDKSFKRETTPLLPPFYLIYVSICVYLLHSEQSSVVLSPWHSPLAHSPGPSCGMLYSARPMEEGHPGTREERKRANTHMLTHSPTHANTYARTNTAVGSRHDPLAGFQIKDRVGRPAFRLNEVTHTHTKKLPHFSTYSMLC